MVSKIFSCHLNGGGTQPAAPQPMATILPNLADITDLSGVARWQTWMIKDLPTPETDFPESYKWNDNTTRRRVCI